MYDFTAAFIAFFTLAGLASAVAVATLVWVAAEQRTRRGQAVIPFGADRQATFRRAA